MRDTDNATEKESRRQVLQKGAIACGGAIGGIGVLSGTVAAEPIEIDECTEIDEPGEYVLTDNLTSDDDYCIRITSNDVKLDGDGHTISGSGSGVGIFTFRASEVRNLTVEGFATGLRLSALGGSSVLRNTLITENINSGIYTPRSSALELRNSTVSDNDGSGINMRSYSDLELRNSTVSDNEGNGISQTYGNNVHISDSALRRNSGQAITAAFCGSFEMKRSSVSKNNEGAAVGSASEIVDCEIKNNSGFGISAASGSEIVDCEIMGNSGFGISFYTFGIGGIDGSVVGNDIQYNDGPGVRFEYSGAEVRDNTIAHNEYGVLVRRTEAGELSHNNIEGNEKYGVKTEFGEVVEATCNYWGHATGPEHEDNPRKNPKGDKVSDNVDFTPWSVREIRDGEGSCAGGRGKENGRGQSGNGR